MSTRDRRPCRALRRPGSTRSTIRVPIDAHLVGAEVGELAIVLLRPRPEDGERARATIRLRSARIVPGLPTPIDDARHPAPEAATSEFVCRASPPRDVVAPVTCRRRLEREKHCATEPVQQDRRQRQRRDQADHQAQAAIAGVSVLDLGEAGKPEHPQADHDRPLLATRAPPTWLIASRRASTAGSGPRASSSRYARDQEEVKVISPGRAEEDDDHEDIRDVDELEVQEPGQLGQPGDRPSAKSRPTSAAIVTSGIQGEQGGPSVDDQQDHDHQGDRRGGRVVDAVESRRGVHRRGRRHGRAGDPCSASPSGALGRKASTSLTIRSTASRDLLGQVGPSAQA